MLIKLDRDISVGVIALFVFMLAGGIAFMYKANTNGDRRDVLPAVHKPVAALPLGAARTIAAPHEFRGSCHFCHPVANMPPTIPAPSRAAPADRVVPRSFGDTTQVALNSPAATAGRTGLLTPAEQNAASKMMIEGHWLGMEAMDLTAGIRRTYQIPADVAGVIIDEITLEAAESGILAGDVVTSIEGRPTRDLVEFLRATEAVGARRKAEVVVSRLGSERRFSLVARNTKTLGPASMEGAQPIRPGALSPHRKRRGACTDCHVIMVRGGQLAVDAGDILPSPPPIAANAKALHQYRGPCNSCHEILAPVRALLAGP